MSKVSILIIALAMLAIPSFAQTIPGTIGFDLVPGNPSFVDPTESGAVVDQDSDIDKAASINVGQTLKTLVRLNGASNLLGVSFDFSFDAAKLELVKMRETLGDLDFSSNSDFTELDKMIKFYVDTIIVAGEEQAPVDGFSYTYNDGTGNITTNPGVLMEGFIKNPSAGNLDFAELQEMINEYIGDFVAATDTPFWTESLKNGDPANYHESVEVFDQVDTINTTGVAADNTVVLLARPADRDPDGTVKDGYGFDGNAILFEAHFRAKAAGAANITITEAVGIDETFASLSDVKNIAIDAPSVVTVNP